MQHIKYNNRNQNINQKKGKDEIKYLLWIGTKLLKIISLKLNKAKQKKEGKGKGGRGKVGLNDWHPQITCLNDLEKSEIDNIEP